MLCDSVFRFFKDLPEFEWAGRYEDRVEGAEICCVNRAEFGESNSGIFTLCSFSRAARTMFGSNGWFFLWLFNGLAEIWRACCWSSGWLNMSNRGRWSIVRTDQNSNFASFKKALRDYNDGACRWFDLPYSLLSLFPFLIHGSLMIVPYRITLAYNHLLSSPSFISHPPQTKLPAHRQTLLGRSDRTLYIAGCARPTSNRG
jgi:hypothetical protein